MVPDNYFIASQFALLSKLMDIHGDNSFKSKSYSIAAFNIEKIPTQLASLEPGEIFRLKGIGESLGKKILQIIQDGTFSILEDYIKKTPPGVLELLSIKGIGPKKISVIWKEMDIESPGELLHACTENRLARFKGFGAKSQESIQQAITFYLNSQGSHLYAEIERYAQELDLHFRQTFPDDEFAITGAFRRQALIIDSLDWVTTVPTEELLTFFLQEGYLEEEVESGSLAFRTPQKVLIRFYSRSRDVFYTTLFETSANDDFLTAWNEIAKPSPSNIRSESEIFSRQGIPEIPPFLREGAAVIDDAKKGKYADIIQPGDIRGIVHSHSDWSDGSHSIEEMALGCIQKGYEYLVISDHSKTAAYANGLPEDRIRQQHLYIDELNKKLAPFRIFKSIESDILGDGSLDYSDKILSGFDLVIASVHSNLKMPEEKATTRLLQAISNPYTTILGHMTGRLLLSRPGYPIDHRAIIDACAENKVVIEINANPRRLDMDWQWIPYALEKGVMLSINPDAHEIAEYDNCRYGVLAAQKGGLTKSANLSSYGLREFEEKIKSLTLKRLKT